MQTLHNALKRRFQEIMCDNDVMSASLQEQKEAYDRLSGHPGAAAKLVDVMQVKCQMVSERCTHTVSWVNLLLYMMCISVIFLISWNTLSLE